MLNHNIFSILFYSIPFSTPNLIIHGLEASSLVPSVLDYYLVGGGGGNCNDYKVFLSFPSLKNDTNLGNEGKEPTTFKMVVARCSDDKTAFSKSV